ncbi:MAG: polyprenol monophosphomannose synthase [bacterium]|nr:polyprenol monophosphomannose synthase [bacterium]
MLKILVIIPTYNEETTIIKLIDALLSLPITLDILIVDDGSDETADLVRERRDREARLHLIKRNEKSGRGSAVLAGLKYGLERDYDYLVEMDADFSHQPDELPALIAVAEPNTVVIGSRYVKGSVIKGWPLARRIFSKFANFYANLILKIGLHDYTNGYRVYGRAALKKLDFEKIKASGYIVLSEIAYQLHRRGVKFKECKSLFVNRRRGQSNFSLREVKESFFSIPNIKKRYFR